MNKFDQHIMPNKKEFEEDPFGYSALGRMRLGIAAELFGFNLIDIENPATSEELKNPILWMTQAEALTQAAILILKSEPEFSNISRYLRGICDGQYRATGLMLIGYSLEICMKAMLIIKKGIFVYNEEEKKYRHHKLHKLSNFIPNLSEKDIAILELLTHYVYWAGRYPDPGYGQENKVEEIFHLAEKYKITAAELFHLASKIMKYTKVVINEHQVSDS
ncbi:hypothetical protein EYS10_06360 [Rahnella aquatilis]|nr:hypothetical protein EYS10_06360 [Rahnella aquatilis]